MLAWPTELWLKISVFPEASGVPSSHSLRELNDLEELKELAEMLKFASFFNETKAPWGEMRGKSMGYQQLENKNLIWRTTLRPPRFVFSVNSMSATILVEWLLLMRPSSYVLPSICALLDVKACVPWCPSDLVSSHIVFLRPTFNQCGCSFAFMQLTLIMCTSIECFQE